MLAAALLLAGWGVARAASFSLAPAGPPTALLDPQQRAALGLRAGPDSIVDVWNDGGRSYLVFSGAGRVDDSFAGGATFRVPVDPYLQSVTGPLEMLMRPDCRGVRVDGGRGCLRFDSDYAGAGTVFTCPSGRVLYVYHGENHTMPNGERAQHGRDGWTGIGMSVWDSSRGVFVRQGQIAGLNASNAWANTATGYGTAQTPAASGNPSLVADPTGAYLYLYFDNRTQNPEATGPGLQCDSRTCSSVARASLPQICAQPGAAIWQLWHGARFAEPALRSDGTGGAFTPLLRHGDNNEDDVVNVTAVPSLHGYVMTSIQRPSNAIMARTSTDGLTWSIPTTLVPAEANAGRGYPRIVQVPGARGDVSLVLLYVKHDGRGWANASLLRQGVRVTSG